MSKMVNLASITYDTIHSFFEENQIVHTNSYRRGIQGFSEVIFERIGEL